MTFEDGSEYNGMFERDRMWNRMLSGDGLKDMTRNQARLRNTRISNNNASRTVDESRANY